MSITAQEHVVDESEPTGQPECTPRPRPPRAVGRAELLTRDEILGAAIEMADAGDLERLTMRLLAKKLQVSAMSLYAHVADKDEILDAIIDHRLRESGLPPLSGDWLGWMGDVADRLRGMLVANPALLDRYARRPVGVTAALDRMEASIAVLRRAGFSARDAIDTFAAVHTYTIGFAALEASRLGSFRATARSSASPLTEADPGYWPAFFASLDAQRFPNLVESCPDLAQFTGSAPFRVGLETLLGGLAARFVGLAHDGSGSLTAPSGR